MAVTKSACIALQDIDSEMNCGDNSGGIRKVAMFYHEDVQTWPTEPTEASDLTAFGQLTGDLIFKEGKCAKVLTLPQNKGSFNISEQGEMGGMSHLMELTLLQNGITAEFLGLMGATKNAKMGFVVMDANGKTYLMGDKDTGANRVPGDGAATGSARTDLATSSIKFQYPCNNPRLYIGDFESLLTPAMGA